MRRRQKKPKTTISKDDNIGTIGGGCYVGTLLTPVVPTQTFLPSPYMYPISLWSATYDIDSPSSFSVQKSQVVHASSVRTCRWRCTFSTPFPPHQYNALALRNSHYSCINTISLKTNLCRKRNDRPSRGSNPRSLYPYELLILNYLRLDLLSLSSYYVFFGSKRVHLSHRTACTYSILCVFVHVFLSICAA
jgi:hypothetical protein